MYIIYILIRGYYEPLSQHNQSKCTSVPAYQRQLFRTIKKRKKVALWAGKTFSLGREKKNNENILYIFVKIFG